MPPGRTGGARTRNLGCEVLMTDYEKERAHNMMRNNQALQSLGSRHYYQFTTLQKQRARETIVNIQDLCMKLSTTMAPKKKLTRLRSILASTQKECWPLSNKRKQLESLSKRLLLSNKRKQLESLGKRLLPPYALLPPHRILWYLLLQGRMRSRSTILMKVH